MNTLKKILLFLNATGYKLSNDLDGVFDNNFTNNKSTAIAMNAGLEICLLASLRLINIPISSSWLIVVIIFSLFFHTMINILFQPELNAIVNDYTHYYKGWLYTIYWVLIVLSIIYGVYLLFSRI